MKKVHKEKKKCSIAFINKEVEAFILGCFLFTWDEILRYDYHTSQKIRSELLDKRWKEERKKAPRHQKQDSINERKVFENLTEYDKNLIYKKNIFTISKLNKTFQKEHNICVEVLNDSLLKFVDSYFASENPTFPLNYNLYQFFDHLKEKHKKQIIKSHRSFFKIPTTKSKIEKEPRCHEKNKSNCLFCDIGFNKNITEHMNRHTHKRFIHTCIKKVLGDKKFREHNNFMMNTNILEDTLVHSIFIERLFQFIHMNTNKELIFLWYKFIALLIDATIDHTWINNIFIFLCNNSFVISSFFARDTKGNEKETQTKGNKKDILKMKKINENGIYRIVIKKEYKLLQNLFDYSCMICCMNNSVFFKRFFKNVQKIKHIYILQLDLFHHYYMKYKRSFKNQTEKEFKNSNSNNNNNNYNDSLSTFTRFYEIRENKKQDLFKFVIIKTLRKKDSSSLEINKNQQEWSRHHENNQYISKKSSPGSYYSQHHSTYERNTEPSKQRNKMSQNKFSNNINFSASIPNNQERKIFLSLQYKDKKGIKIRYKKSKDRYTEEKLKRIIKNLKIVFNKSNTFLNLYITNKDVINQNNIFSFLFDSLPTFKMKFHCKQVLEPLLFKMIPRESFINTHYFIQAIRWLYSQHERQKQKKRKKKEKKEEDDKELMKKNEKWKNFLQYCQSLNYIFHNLKLEHLRLSQHFHSNLKMIKGMRKRQKKDASIIETIISRNGKDIRDMAMFRVTQEDCNHFQYAYTKDHINYLIKHENTTKHANINISTFSSKSYDMNRDLFNIYLYCNLFGKAYQVNVEEYGFSLSMTAEVLFLFKMHLIEIQKGNIAYSFELLIKAVHKCFILVKKYLCNPNSFKLLSMISLQVSTFLYHYPCLLMLVTVSAEQMRTFIENHVMINQQNDPISHYEMYGFKNRRKIEDLYTIQSSRKGKESGNTSVNISKLSFNATPLNGNNVIVIDEEDEEDNGFGSFPVEPLMESMDDIEKERSIKNELDETEPIPSIKKDSPFEKEYINNYNYLSAWEKAKINKVLRSFHLFFNVLDRNLHDVNLNIPFINSTISSKHTIQENQLKTTWNDSVGSNNQFNLQRYVKHILNKIRVYFNTSTNVTNIKEQAKQKETNKYRNLFYDTEERRKIKKEHMNAHLESLEFLYLSFVCSNYFVDGPQTKNKQNMKSFNMNTEWISNAHLKVKILLFVMHILLYDIQMMDLKESFLEIMKMFLDRFYDIMDYNDVQMFHTIYLHLSNVKLFPEHSYVHTLQTKVRKFEVSDSFLMDYHLCGTNELVQYVKYWKREKKQNMLWEFSKLVRRVKEREAAKVLMYRNFSNQSLTNNTTRHTENQVGGITNSFNTIPLVTKKDTQKQKEKYSSKKGQQKKLSSFLRSFDSFKSEKSFEENDFIFCKKETKDINEMKQANHESILDKLLKKCGIEIYNKENEKELKKKEEEKEKTEIRKSQKEQNFDSIYQYFKNKKEVYIHNCVLEQRKYTATIYEDYEKKMNYYVCDNNKQYETTCFINPFVVIDDYYTLRSFLLAINQSEQMNHFSFEKKGYMNIALHLIGIIDLLMEHKKNIYNEPLYIVKHFLTTCADICYGNDLPLLYIHCLIRLSLFELRMNNFFVATTILLEVLSHFEKVKMQKNLLGTIFYLCGYLMIHDLNENALGSDEIEQNLFIEEYNEQLNYKKQFDSLHGKNKKENGESLKVKNFFDQFHQKLLKEQSIDLDLYESILKLHKIKEETKEPEKENNIITDENLNKDIVFEQKKSSKTSYDGKKRNVKKESPVLKNQIKITDFFSNSKNRKHSDKEEEVDSKNVPQRMRLRDFDNRENKRRKINENDVSSYKKKFITNRKERLQNNVYVYEKLKEKQFTLFLICFYMKQALYHWKLQGDTIGITKGIQQKKRMKDAFFFLMSSYKFLYKSSTVIPHCHSPEFSKSKKPFVNIQIYNTYYNFYVYYKRKFIRC